ncbi:hypothetical protein [Pseudophaeobacter sp. C1-32P7]|uniref:hypothetical protein n=1 Tax=Pseudophaeobacter sp. C1-32P7 TaxID=3098142 RepID=UPI0034D505D7
MQVTIGHWAYFGTEQSVKDALSDLRQATVATADGAEVPLFRGRTVTNLYRDLPITFASSGFGGSRNAATPLIAGHLERVSLRNSRSAREAGEVTRMVANATLNVTRFIQAQQFRRITRLSRPRLVSEYVLAIEPNQAWYVDEFPLVPATNVLIGERRKYAHALAHDLSDHFRDNVETADRLLSEALVFGSDGYDVEIRRLPHFGLSEIEIYWEFDHHDPIRLVETMSPWLSRLSRELRRTREFVEDYHEHLEGQSLKIELRLAHAKRLRVYSKTNRRVRMEVILEAVAISDICGARTATNLEEAAGWVNLLVADAARELNQVLDGAPGEMHSVPQYTPVELISRVHAAVEDHHVARAMLSTLVAYGRIAPGLNDALASAKDALARAGVIQTIRPGNRIYVIADEYAAALEALRETTGAWARNNRNRGNDLR